MNPDGSEELGVELPWQKLEPDTLRRLLEEFVTRQQSESGDDLPLEARVREVQQLLRQGKAAVLFDPLTESFTLAVRV